MNNNKKSRLLTTTTIAAIILVTTIVMSIGTQQQQLLQLVLAKSSNRDVGYNDGCIDAQHPISNNLAINQHSNAQHHSAEYMAGYNEAMFTCANQKHGVSQVSNTNYQDNSNQNNRVQAQSQTATTSQHCFVLVGSCSGPIVAQGQSLNN